MTNTDFNLTPLPKNILFKFTEEVKNGFFNEKTSSGIIIDMGGNHKFSADYCRIAEVLAIGSDIQHVKKGDRIAIKTLMWTDASNQYNGVRFWMTHEEHVVGVVE